MHALTALATAAGLSGPAGSESAPGERLRATLRLRVYADCVDGQAAARGWPTELDGIPPTGHEDLPSKGLTVHCQGVL